MYFISPEVNITHMFALLQIYTFKLLYLLYFLLISIIIMLVNILNLNVLVHWIKYVQLKTVIL